MNIALRSLNIICTAGVLLSTNVLPVTAADSAPVTEPIAVSQVGGLAAPKIVKARKGRAHISSHGKRSRELRVIRYTARPNRASISSSRPLRAALTSAA